MGAGDLVSFCGLGMSLKREKMSPIKRKITIMMVGLTISGFLMNEDVDFLNCWYIFLSWRLCLEEDMSLIIYKGRNTVRKGWVE